MWIEWRNFVHKLSGNLDEMTMGTVSNEIADNAKKNFDRCTRELPGQSMQVISGIDQVESTYCGNKKFNLCSSAMELGGKLS